MKIPVLNLLVLSLVCLVAAPQTAVNAATRSGTVTLPAGVLNGEIDVTDEASSSGGLHAASAGTRPHKLSVDEADTVLGRTFAGRLNVHNPIYFVYGSGDQAAKFQLSFKYRAATFSGNAEKGSLSTLQFGYTQRSLWDLGGDSSPFYDTSHLPEVFWEWYKLPQPEETGYVSWLGLQSGLQHESNGRDGTESRSLNSAYMRAAFSFGLTDGWNLKLIPEAWIYGSLDEDEAIDDYRGFTKLDGVFGKADSVALRFSLSPGKNFDRPTYQLDLTMPVHVSMFDVAVFFHVQYFNGYGESLLSYDHKSDAFRLGLSLTR